MSDPTEEIRQIWAWLDEAPDNLRKAIDRMEPSTAEATMNLNHLLDCADKIEELEGDFEGTFMEVTE